MVAHNEPEVHVDEKRQHRQYRLHVAGRAQEQKQRYVEHEQHQHLPYLEPRIQHDGGVRETRQAQKEIKDVEADADVREELAHPVARRERHYHGNGEQMHEAYLHAARAASVVLMRHEVYRSRHVEAKRDDYRGQNETHPGFVDVKQKRQGRNAKSGDDEYRILHYVRPSAS